MWKASVAEHAYWGINECQRVKNYQKEGSDRRFNLLVMSRGLKVLVTAQGQSEGCRRELTMSFTL